MKRGASAIVAWVLLLGFTLALATGVFYWTKTQAEDMTESTINYVAGEMECQDISLNVIKDGNNLQITNKGYFTVDKIAIRTSSTSEIIDIALRPKETIPILPSIDIISGFEVIPIILTENDQEVGCKDKTIKVTSGIPAEQPLCTKDCTGRVCGPDPICGESCGNCQTGYCDNGQCIQEYVYSCSGTPKACNIFMNQSSCQSQSGCTWNPINFNVRLNSATGLSCTTLCSNNGETCSSIGTNVGGTDTKYYIPIGGIGQGSGCTSQTLGSCATVMTIKTISCYDHFAYWTYCNCQKSASCSGTPALCDTFLTQSDCLAQKDCTWS